MTPPAAEPARDRQPLPREAKARPQLRPERPPPSRSEGIAQAILTWLDEQR